LRKITDLLGLSIGDFAGSRSVSILLHHHQVLIVSGAVHNASQAVLCGQKEADNQRRDQAATGRGDQPGLGPKHVLDYQGQ
jgi:hypothetical protein